MRTLILTILMFVAPVLMAQEVIIPHDTMREAWSESSQTFDSLSRDYGNLQDDRYGYPKTERRNRLSQHPLRRHDGRRRGETEDLFSDSNDSEYDAH